MMSAATGSRKLKTMLALGLLAVAFAGAVAPSASADRDDWRRDRHQGWKRDHDWRVREYRRTHDWRNSDRDYYGGGYYTRRPPAVIYAPPPPPPGIDLYFGLGR